ncbi:MAG TPA: ATP-dependent DNA ligase, partial [Luteimonas sp.]|nr:ATP-dependent DNA ligase [Luteimonas sp.]
MKRFAQLFRELDRSTATLDKRAALVAYFREAPPRDAAWALALLSGGKITGPRKRIANTCELREWIGQESGLPDWLVDDSYDQVGDLGETLALLVDDPPEASEDVALADWIEQRLLPVANQDVEVRRAVVVGAWRTLRYDERLLFNKLLTGALRVGVSQRVVQQALAEMSGIDIARIAQRMLGGWAPTPEFLANLLDPAELAGDRQQPYPFFLASPLESALRPADADSDASGFATADAVAAALGDIGDWLLEWKWDGIRLQVIRRDGEVALWSRGEERLDGRFPEVEAAAATLPRDCVLDGELLGWRDDGTAPMAFTALQTRIQRLKPGPKTLADTPVRVQVYDLLELDGEDLRARPQSERRALLETLVSTHAHPRIVLSPVVQASSWDQAAVLREDARERGVEGLMLKRLSAPYQSGR